MKTWEELETPRDLIRRAVWQQALSMERWGYLDAHDQDMIFAKTFDRLNLMLNLKSDAISAGQIPPPILTSEDLEEGRLEKGLLRLIRWFRSRFWRGKRHLHRAVKEHYAFNLAVALVGQRVAERIQQLSQQLAEQIDPTMFEACASWHASMSQDIFTRLNAQEEQHPELFRAIQQHFLKQAIQVSARERLEKLLTDGIISQGVGNKLAEQLESEKHAG